MSKTRYKNPKGKRYTEAEKKKILNHVEHVNKTRGRGGIASASREFNVTALTIGNWLKANDVFALPMRGAKRSSSAAGVLRRLADLHDEIAKRERDLLALRKEFENLKRSL